MTADRVALLLAGDDVYVFDAGDERIVIQYTVLVGANLDVDGPIYMTMEAWDRRFSALAPAEANIVDCRTGSGGRGRPGGTARVFAVSASDMGRCPKQSIAAGHYRDDGTCRCDEEATSGNQ